jgi:hypothetical protein
MFWNINNFFSLERFDYLIMFLIEFVLIDDIFVLFIIAQIPMVNYCD